MQKIMKNTKLLETKFTVQYRRTKRISSCS